MKVLYISYYKESNSDWADAAISNMIALDKVGIDVVARPVVLTGNGETPREIRHLENKSSEGCDVCIQHVLPNHLTGSTKFKKNIAYFPCDSVNMNHLPWFVNLQEMDEVWVQNESAGWMLHEEMEVPVRVVPQGFNIEHYTKKYKDLNIPQVKDRFKFYYTGELSERKNIDAIIRCFHAEFDISEPVSLILNVSKAGFSPDQVQQALDQKISQIKSSLRMYSDVSEYHKDIIISHDVSKEQTYALHQYCDCFVSPSRGESWPVDSFEAMAFGSTPICSNTGGASDFIDDEEELTGKLVSGSYAPCQCSDAPFPDMFTGREYWFNPCDMQIRKAMRLYYKNKDKKREKKIAGLERAKLFSHEKVGNIMKEWIV